MRLDDAIAVEDVDAITRVDCRHRARCLTLACREAWHGMGCVGCPSYGQRDRDELIDEVEALLSLGLWLGEAA